jgi:c-di-GMP-related signal transduction protein
MQVSTFFLGRQPILDRDQSLVAYELLFRSDSANRAIVHDDFAASATVINHAFNELGMDATLGSNKGFINASESVLMSEMIELLPTNKIVFEILETVELSQEILERCQSLKAQGFQLALDDCTSASPALDPIFELVDLIKVDVLLLDPASLSSVADGLRRTKRPLLAEKVENREQFLLCRDLGFQFFQGYYFAKPELISGKRLSPSELGLLRLLGLVMADAEDHAIENALKQYPGISLNLLRLANSSAYGARRESRTIAAAITLLGRNQLRRWLQVLLYSTQNNSVDPQHNPLLQLAATRGKLMELLALRKGDRAFGENAFMTGILSLMDTLFGVPLQEILSSIPLDPSVSEALLERQGALGNLLDLAIGLEQESPESLAGLAAKLPEIPLEEIAKAQAEAMKWASLIGS